MNIKLKTMVLISIVLTLLVIVTPPAYSQDLDRHVVPCGVQQKACTCRPDADECEFTLIVSEFYTFTSYNIEESENDAPYALEGGSPYFINSMGNLQPSLEDPESSCYTNTEDFSNIDCTMPLTVDGKAYRPAFAINGLIPGPTLIVHEGQQIIANVTNNLLNEGITIHWHGMLQRKTPWMDGALGITQCPINPRESFQYYFQAEPTGTFWYHSHSITQRTDGLFGALIIRENGETRQKLEQAVGSTIIDDPASFTLNLHEWSDITGNELFAQVQGGLPFYPGKTLGEVPLPPSQLAAMGLPQYQPYGASAGPDGVDAGDIPFWSALINGKGRYNDVPYNSTRLEIFSVSEGNSYRFRLVGAQGLYPYKFSIDEHNLTIISTDGVLIQPGDVQFIIIFTGERYDFVLNAQKPRSDVQDYWMKFETLEVDLTSGLPYEPLGNVAEGILHYTSTPGADQLPLPTSYQSIKDTSIPYDPDTCGSLADGGCKAVNCPFPDFHSSYNIRCVNLADFRLLEPIPSENLPSSDVDSECEDCEVFFNINSDIDGVNGRNFHLPTAPLLTQKQNIDSSEFCDLDATCSDSQCEDKCVHVRDINSFNKTIRIVLTSISENIATDGASHPMHLHGHHFHVAKIGYGSYNPQNGFLTGPSSDIICNDPFCSKPRWNGTRPTFNVSNRTITKDTVVVPPGGYVVIHFIADNPGYWFLHCHITADFLEGMAVIINELESMQNPAPEGFGVCGNFNLSQDAYYEKRAFVPGNGGEHVLSNILLIASFYGIIHLLL